MTPWLSNDTLGRALDKLWNVGTNKVLGTVMLGVMQNHDLDTSHVYHDTTSKMAYLAILEIVPEVSVTPPG